MSSSGPTTGRRGDRPEEGEGREGQDPFAAGPEREEPRDEPSTPEGSGAGSGDGPDHPTDQDPPANGIPSPPPVAAPVTDVMGPPRPPGAEPLPAPPTGAPGPLTEPGPATTWPPGRRPLPGPSLRPRRRPRQPRPQPPGRLVRERLRHISPWSVLKIAAIFYLCIAVVLLVSSFFLWRFARGSGMVDDLEGFVTQLFTYGECVAEDDLELGQEAEPDEDCPADQVRVGGFEINDGALFRAVFMISVIFGVAATAGTVFLVLLFNLLSDITGGVRYSVVREPVGTGPPSPTRSTGPRPGR